MSKRTIVVLCPTPTTCPKSSVSLVSAACGICSHLIRWASFLKQQRLMLGVHSIFAMRKSVWSWSISKVICSAVKALCWLEFQRAAATWIISLSFLLWATTADACEIYDCLLNNGETPSLFVDAGVLFPLAPPPDGTSPELELCSHGRAMKLSNHHETSILRIASYLRSADRCSVLLDLEPLKSRACAITCSSNYLSQPLVLLLSRE